MYRSFLYSILFLVFTMLSTIVSANDSTSFQVHSVIPDNQIDSEVSYYHVPYQAGAKQQLQFVLENTSDKEKIINVDTANALSSPLVNIDYHSNEKTYYSTFSDFSFAIKELISIPDSIILKPFEKSTFTFSVDMPNVLPEGELLGAISFYEQNDLPIKSKQKNEMNVKIQQKYTIAILLDTKIIPETIITVPSISSDVSTGEPLLFLDIVNQTPAIVSGLNLSYTVYSEATDKMLFSDSLELKAFAPKTSMKVPVRWGTDDLLPGSYRIDYSISKDDKPVFSDSTAFTIEQKDVEDLIEAAEKTQKNITVVSNSIPWWSWVLLVLVGLFVLYRLFVFFKKRKKVS